MTKLKIGFFGGGLQGLKCLEKIIEENSIHVEEYNMLEKYIHEILNEKMYSERLIKSRNYITKNFNINNDGYASDRILQILIDENNRKNEVRKNN